MSPRMSMSNEAVAMAGLKKVMTRLEPSPNQHVPAYTHAAGISAGTTRGVAGGRGGDRRSVRSTAEHSGTDSVPEHSGQLPTQAFGMD